MSSTNRDSAKDTKESGVRVKPTSLNRVAEEKMALRWFRSSLGLAGEANLPPRATYSISVYNRAVLGTAQNIWNEANDTQNVKADIIN